MGKGLIFFLQHSSAPKLRLSRTISKPNITFLLVIVSIDYMGRFWHPSVNRLSLTLVPETSTRQLFKRY